MIDNLIALLTEVIDFIKLGGDGSPVFFVSMGAVILVLLSAAVLVQVIKKNELGHLEKRSRRRASGIIFGWIPWRRKLLCLPEKSMRHGSHTTLFASSGAGKSSSIVTPSLRNLKPTARAYVIDVSDDISKNVIHNKIVYAPDSANTSPYNPLWAIDAAESEQEKLLQIELLVKILLSDIANADSTSKFYLDESRIMLEMAFRAYIPTGMEFCEICRVIAEMTVDELITDIKNSGNSSAIRLVSGFEGTNEKQLASTKQEVNKAIKLYSDNTQLATTLRRSAINPKILEENNFYVRIPEGELLYWSPLLRLITAQVFSYLFSRPITKHMPQIICFLDEAAALKLSADEILLPALMRLRKHNVHICMCWQSVATLDRLYGEAARREILDNCGYTAVISANDYQTKELFSQMAGDKKVIKTTISKRIDINQAAKAITESTSEVTERLIKPADFSHLNKRLVLFHPRGVSLLRLNPYYEPLIFGWSLGDWLYKRRAKKQMARDKAREASKRLATYCREQREIQKKLKRGELVKVYVGEFLYRTMTPTEAETYYAEREAERVEAEEREYREIRRFVEECRKRFN